MRSSRARRKKRARHAANKYTNGVGGFVATRLTRARTVLTLWIEGRDEDGPSVAGLGLDIAGGEHLISRLQNSVREIKVAARKKA